MTDKKVQKTVSDIMEGKLAWILDEWLGRVRDSGKTQMTEADREGILRDQSSDLLKNLIGALRDSRRSEGQPNFSAAADPLRNTSAAWAEMGFTPRETAEYILTLKDVLFECIHSELDSGISIIHDEYQLVTRMIDNLVIFTFETFVERREEVIAHQSRSLLELSTPVTKLWEGVLLLPLVGVVDTVRTQHIMEHLLAGIVENEARVVVLDVSGVPVIDTRVALHLMKTVTAARMLGTEVVITGISPEAAQTIVTLDIDLGNIRTAGKLQAGMAEAFKMIGLRIISEERGR